MKGSMRLGVLLLLAAVAGCKNDSQDLVPDAGIVRAVHAIPDLGTLTMNLDSGSLGDFEYGAIRGINRPGDGNHEIAFDVKQPGGMPSTRLETLNVATGVDRANTIVLTGTADEPNVIQWEQPARDWDEEAANSDDEITVLEVSFGHAALSRGALDIYLGESPVDPTTSTPIATLSYSDLSPFIEIDADVLEIVVTPAGDPETELYDSDSLVLPPATSLLFVAFDGAKLEGDTPWLSMRSLGEAFSNVIPNNRVPAMARAAHSARGTGSLDLIGEDDDETLIGGLEFEDVSPYVVIPTGTTSVDFALTEDPDEVIAVTTVVASAGSDSTIMIAGEPDSETTITLADDTRRISTAAKLRVINGDTDFNTMDLYVLEPGTSVDDVNPTVAAVTYPFATGYIGFAEGEYDLVLTETASKDPIAGPTRLNLRNGGIYGVLATQASQDDRTELVLIDDFAD
jgi:hypothetical protein